MRTPQIARWAAVLFVVQLLLFVPTLHAEKVPDIKGPMADALLPTGLSGLRVGLNLMVGYQHDDSPALDQFVAKRAYIDVRVKPRDWLDIRITPDVYPDDDGTEYRLKYGYGKVHVKQAGFIATPFVEMGLVHTPWLEFEEHINPYRLQDPLYQERVGLITSADYGITFGGRLGGTLDKKAIEKLGGTPDPGLYGSFAFGAYNGAGYYSAEQNSNKTLMSRITVRPLPYSLTGLQFSHHFILGRGNREENFTLNLDGTGPVINTLPLYLLNGVMVSWEQRFLTLTAQGVMGSGNRHGTNLWTGPSNADYNMGDALEYQGGSLFGEFRLHPYPFSLIGRFDMFDKDVNNPDNGLNRIIGGITFRPDKTFRILVDIEQTDYENPSTEDEYRIQVMMQFKTI